MVRHQWERRHLANERHDGLNQASSFVTNVPGGTWSIVGTGDFNGDGKSDILWRDTSGNVAIWEMNGTTILN